MRFQSSCSLFFWALLQFDSVLTPVTYSALSLTALWTSQSHISPSYLQLRRSNANLDNTPTCHLPQQTWSSLMSLVLWVTPLSSLSSRENLELSQPHLSFTFSQHTSPVDPTSCISPAAIAVFLSHPVFTALASVLTTGQTIIKHPCTWCPCSVLPHSAPMLHNLVSLVFYYRPSVKPLKY